MPITRSAKKALRGSEKKKVFNLRRKRTMKDSVKGVVSSANSKDKKQAETKLSEAYKAIDKAAKNGVIKKNTASRKKARLSKMVAKI
ncbi:30S ribosomal protein S20 [Candidatus Campbellbacteria bacterium RIFCSPLOWO2_02_FULL_35_11]|uniref:Small ribosomal subunit protein bS20 n=2 Tax=Candidatus Campbelliibacteriota TaxID=1752727 RepID=A0A1F5EQ74_9BACT|nr:MAG: 30S ribosomal protein S20 [Candidatus Campbellbacteria bacterium RIFCSPHIGHO2_12_FULL_35_10]OGD69752.1 MAG: 30S ribosomal protein S20 [Candidatus Campbellbacteria bacterium RIFCSPLOWO2_02_FULL_35_11]